jgi:hypothetical protein
VAISGARVRDRLEVDTGRRGDEHLGQRPDRGIGRHPDDPVDLGGLTVRTAHARSVDQHLDRGPHQGAATTGGDLIL